MTKGVEELSARQRQLDRLEAQLQALDAAIARDEERLADRQREVAAADAQAEVASAQADRAVTSAAGDLLGQEVFRIDDLRFEHGTAELTPQSKRLLDRLADRLSIENVAYFLEIQSHSAGGDAGLGRARTEAIRRYLHDGRGLPLHTMTVADAGARAAEVAGAPEPTLTVNDDPDGPGALAIVVMRALPRP